MPGESHRGSVDIAEGMSDRTLRLWRRIVFRRRATSLFWWVAGLVSVVAGEVPPGSEADDPAIARVMRAAARVCPPTAWRRDWTFMARAHHWAGGLFDGALAEAGDGVVWQPARRWRADGVRRLPLTKASIVRVESRQLRWRGRIVFCLTLESSTRVFLVGSRPALEPLRSVLT